MATGIVTAFWIINRSFDRSREVLMSRPQSRIRVALTAVAECRSGVGPQSWIRVARASKKTSWLRRRCGGGDDGGGDNDNDDGDDDVDDAGDDDGDDANDDGDADDVDDAADGDDAIAMQ